MSIQEGLHSSIFYRICSKLKIIYIYDTYLKTIQFFYRKLFFLFNSQKKISSEVFFDYYNHYTHPDIKKRYYGSRAPISWSNLNSSKVVHCIQSSSKRFSGKKVIVEPNDHVLVIGGSLGIYKPSETVRRSKEISDFISSPAISRVLIGNNDLIHHARYYYSDNALKKFIIYPEFSCIPKVSEFFLREKSKKLSFDKKIRFLSIASNFRKKAVDLLIEAFLESKSLGELTLVCHDIPESLRVKILKTNNINLIEDIPLSQKKKDYLYRNSDVYINTAYIDGGAVAVNALEYGLPIITHTYHRGKSYITNKNGILLSEPMKYYDPKSYGIDWDSINEYLEQVEILKKNGGFVKVQKQLIESIKYYESQPDKILIQGIRSLNLAKKNSLEKSNQMLREIYMNVSNE
jgi:hypothetical protein